MTLTGSHRLEQIVAGNRFQRSGGQVGGFGAGSLDDNAGVAKSLHDLLNQPGWDTKVFTDLNHAWRRFSTNKALSDASHESQSNKLTSALVDMFNLLLFQVRSA